MKDNMALDERISEAMKILALGARRHLEEEATRIPQPVAEKEGGAGYAGKCAGQ